MSIDTIEQLMYLTIQQTKSEGFNEVGISYGVADRSEADTDYGWISLADQRMYEMKNNKKCNELTITDHLPFEVS